MEKVVAFSPAWDKRNPNPSKNYGIHGVELRFVLKGNLGAVQFVVFTNWHLPHVQEELNARAISEYGYAVDGLLPMAADWGYHSPKPQYDGQSKNESCEYLGGKPCYYDGSGLHAGEVYKKFLKGGDAVVWKELEEFYVEKFGRLA